MSTVEQRVLASIAARTAVKAAVAESNDAEHAAQLANLEGTGSTPAGLPQTVESCAPLYNFVSDGTRASGKSDALVIDGVTFQLPRSTDSLKGLAGKLKVGSFAFLFEPTWRRCKCQGDLARLRRQDFPEAKEPLRKFDDRWEASATALTPTAHAITCGATPPRTAAASMPAGARSEPYNRGL
eukprot:CAMPEP_0115830414 /NCGR_PEP_ID=MMETSP0287-20121206/1605_1 /TAXON_ID=412157 /ORGANISM="Chrysochromulina rotalis, Strain UIO044" /LENGTH=182 /DNA_ID=CAMNT_0003283717 /DNA_START=173 /DNA_END=719 /DNA_ORIENTATION=-